MKASQIQIGNHYTIQLGKNTTAVKVASFDNGKSTWLCETESGKILRVGNLAQFLKEIKPKHRECKAGKKVRENMQQRSPTVSKRAGGNRPPWLAARSRTAKCRSSPPRIWFYRRRAAR